MTPAEDQELKTVYTRGLDFWMVYVSNLMVDMLSVLDTVYTCSSIHH